jgi:hypothetical protein
MHCAIKSPASGVCSAGLKVFGGDDGWEIPRSDDCPSADGNLKCEEALVGIAGRDDGSFKTLHVFRCDAEILRSLLHLGKRFGEIRFALFKGNDRGDLFLVGQDSIGNAVASRGAFKWRSQPPAVAGFARRRNRMVYIIWRCVRNGRQQFSSRRTVDLEPFGVVAIHPFSVNEKFLRGQRGENFFCFNWKRTHIVLLEERSSVEASAAV